MAAPAWANYAEAGTGFGNLVSASKPTGTVEGDVLVSDFSSDDPDQSFTVPTGFDEVETISAADHTHAVHLKVAGASEPASYDFGIGSEQAATLELSRITGADATDPVDASASDTGATGQPVQPSVTTTGADRWLGYFVARGEDSGGNPGGSAPSGATFRYREDRGSGSSGVEAYLADDSQASAGASGTATWALDDATPGWSTITVALQASGGGEPPAEATTSPGILAGL